MSKIWETVIDGNNVKINAPEELLYDTNSAYRKISEHITPDDANNICQILMNPEKSIFTEPNIREISSYGVLNIDGKEHYIGSSRQKDILLSINDGDFGKNDVLYDISKRAEKGTKMEVTKYLLSEGYLSTIAE